MKCQPEERSRRGSVKPGRSVLPPIVILVVLTGCVHAPLNKPLKRYDQSGGFRYTPRAAGEPGADIAVLLFFSGGGKRAAALSYGVLRELRDTTVPDGEGGERRLLDDVEIVSSVSGGSFTSAYFGLHHDGIFVDYERRFLKRNLNLSLIAHALLPTEWPRLASPWFGRSDLAAACYDQEIFDGATFGDLVKAGGRPMLLINATDMANGEQFSFTQIRFDLIGSDLNSFPVARAVAASSAAPPLLTPITIQNHAGAAGPVESVFLPRAEPEISLSPRERRVRRLMLSYTDAEEYPFIHLVDGGLSDNLGLRSLMDASVLQGGIMELGDRIGMRPAEKLVVIIVNAAARRGGEWSKREAVPGIVNAIQRLTDNIGYQVNDRSQELFHVMLDDWRGKERARGNVTADYYLVQVDFDEIESSEERRYFQNLPTTFSLPDATIDRVVDAGARLLRRSPEFQRLIADTRTGDPRGN